MEKIDARTYSQEVQEALRQQIIRLRKEGRANKDVAEIVGVSIAHASRVWTRYQKEGANSIAKRKRGRRKGEKRTLTPEQETLIQRLLIDRTPDQLKLPFALWTRSSVQQLIRQQCGFEMPIRTVGEYLNRWGFTPQKPAKMARERSTLQVGRWLLLEYPRVVARAKAEKAEIYWGDETGLQTGANVERGYAPRGKTPRVRLPAKRERINMISAITNQGKVRFMFYRDNMNSQRLIDFMRRLVKDAGRKVFLVLDNLRVHHSEAVKEWLEKNRERIEVIYLPPYSPELNPDEYLNGDLKGRVHSGQPVRNGHDLEKKARKHMHRLQRQPAKVKSFFQNPHVKYAAH